ncbi:hypothetical protein OG558_05675 [Kribbella sp. NBC_01510]|uniref:hypothetical protein n=1 Tax=Kribbella sp. NBC_01510 TaxID=2903581 RepID=UPI00386EDC92
MSQLVFEERLDQLGALTAHDLCAVPREVGGRHVKLCNDLADVQQPPDFRTFRNVQDATEFCSHIGTTGRFCQVAEAIYAARM